MWFAIIYTYYDVPQMLELEERCGKVENGLKQNGIKTCSVIVLFLPGRSATNLLVVEVDFPI